MINFTVLFLCTAGLFLCLLEDRFRVWISVGAVAAVFLLALLAAPLFGRFTEEALLSRQLSAAGGILLFFLSSLALFRDSFLQKAFVALLSLVNFAFLDFFVPLLMGAVSPARTGNGGLLFPSLCCVLFFLLIGLCLYHPLHHSSDRGPSGFLLGMCAVLLAQYALCLGLLDFLFRTNLFAARLLCAALIYCGVIFVFRSVYQAERFRERRVWAAARERTLQMELSGIDDTLAAVREVRAAQKAGEYARDTVSVMLRSGQAEEIPAYLASLRQEENASPLLGSYHEDPYLNAVIASKASYAAQHQIAFESNAVIGNSSLSAAELCVITGELLGRACRDAAEFDGPRKLRFTVLPAEESLRFEVLYSAKPREAFTFRGKSAAEILRHAFEDPRVDEDLRDLENTREIVARHSGSLSLSEAGENELILQASIRY